MPYFHIRVKFRLVVPINFKRDDFCADFENCVPFIAYLPFFKRFQIWFSIYCFSIYFILYYFIKLFYENVGSKLLRLTFFIVVVFFCICFLFVNKIYCFKIYLFRGEFELIKLEEQRIRNVCTFLLILKRGLKRPRQWPYHFNIYCS